MSTPGSYRFPLTCAVVALACVAGVLAPAASTAEPAGPRQRPSPADRFVGKLGPGLNLSTLEAPSEGDWNPKLTRAWFDRAAEAGFTTVRLPVRFSNHAGLRPPFTIDEAIFERVDFALRQARRLNLRIVIDMHHYRQLDGDPLDEGEQSVAPEYVDRRFVALWRQIARRYADRPRSVVFELYNEPHGRLTPRKWNALLRQALAVVRKSNPRRLVVVGPTSWNSADDLDELRLPRRDRRLIVTIHNYEPFEFTHQGADWVDGSEDWLGTTCCSKAQIEAMARPLDVAAAWSERTDRPVLVGEFGSYEQADMDSRVAYTEAARRLLEERDLPWAYWDFLGNFGIYDPVAEDWRAELRDALVY